MNDENDHPAVCFVIIIEAEDLPHLLMMCFIFVGSLGFVHSLILALKRFPSPRGNSWFLPFICYHC